MIFDLSKNIISPNDLIKDAMEKINFFPTGSTLFVIDDVTQKVIGTLTDGDIRRGLLNGTLISDVVKTVMKTSFKFLTKGNYYNDDIEAFKIAQIKTIPLLDIDGKLLNIYDLTYTKSVLPLDVVIMAGGKGERLKPMTETTPKPLLIIGKKPIIEHNIDRLISCGVDTIYISVSYLADKIKDYFKNGESKKISIKYIDEDKPLGTIGAVSKVEHFYNEHVLVMNSDLLTTIDFADFYKAFITQNADVAIASIPYKVSVPYAVLETSQNKVSALSEKPTYTYYSNAGIYLIKKELLKSIPFNTYYNATDLIEFAISQSKNVISFPILEYWLDIGNPQDYIKAQEDVNHLKL